ncbi:MAG TPA: hypothetical protein VIX80_10655 [Candidatus Kapabacteria bacterium]
MATQRPQTRQRTTVSKSSTKQSSVRPFQMPFESKNIMIILGGILFITLGYFLMSSDEVMGSMALNVSPIILLLGYLVVIPFGIMYGSKGAKRAENATPENS